MVGVVVMSERVQGDSGVRGGSPTGDVVLDTEVRRRGYLHDV